MTLVWLNDRHHHWQGIGDPNIPEGDGAKIPPSRPGDTYLDLETNTKYAYDPEGDPDKWFIISSSAADMFGISLILTHGTSRTVRVLPNTLKVITLKPKKGFLPPEKVDVSPATALEGYDSVTGKITILATTNVIVRGDCILNPPHTYLAMSDFMHDELTEFTHAELKGINTIKKTTKQRCKS